MRVILATMVSISLLSCSESANLSIVDDCENLEPASLVKMMKSVLDPIYNLPEEGPIRRELLSAIPNIEVIQRKAKECQSYHQDAPYDGMETARLNYHIDRAGDFLDIQLDLNILLFELETNSALDASLLGIKQIWKETYSEMLVEFDDT
jgi:hypothetical protein